MDDLHLALALGTALVLVLGLFSGYFDERSLASQQMMAVAIGVAIGPSLLNIIDPHSWPHLHSVIEMAARITLAIGLMEVALRLPAGYPLRHWRALLPLLTLAMPVVWLSAGLILYLVLDIPFWLAMLIGAIVAATDPIAASSIVASKTADRNIPERIRHLLSAESGANDGLAYLLVFLPLLMLTHDTGDALRTWLTRVLLWEVGVAAIAGAIAGFGAGKLLRWSEDTRLANHDSILAYSLALSLFVVTAARVIGTNDIFCVFVAAATFNIVAGRENRSQEEVAQVGVNQLLVLPMFGLFGLLLPWSEWLELGWRAVAVAVLVLLLRRVPAIALLRHTVAPLRTWADTLFYGWFGPVGIAAIFYAMIAMHETGYAEIWTLTSLIIAASVIGHGMTSTPFSKAYGSYRRLKQPDE